MGETIVPSASLRLGAGLEIAEDGIHDPALDFTYRLSPPARLLLEPELTGGSRFDVLEAAADRTGLSVDELEQQFGQLCESLRDRGLVRTGVRQRWAWMLPAEHTVRGWAAAAAAAVLHVFVGFYEPTTTRYPATLSGVVRAVLAALWLPLAAVTLVTASILWPVSGAARDLDADLVFKALIPVWVTSAALVTYVVHEYAHVIALRRRAAACIVLRRGPGIAVGHRLADRTGRARVALAGPAAGAFACLPLGLLTAALPFPSGMPLAMVLVSFVHAWSLMPWQDDGKILFTSLRRETA